MLNHKTLNANLEKGKVLLTKYVLINALLTLQFSKILLNKKLPFFHDRRTELQ